MRTHLLNILAVVIGCTLLGFVFVFIWLIGMMFYGTEGNTLTGENFMGTILIAALIFAGLSALGLRIYRRVKYRRRIRARLDAIMNDL